MKQRTFWLAAIGGVLTVALAAQFLSGLGGDRTAPPPSPSRPSPAITHPLGSGPPDAPTTAVAPTAMSDRPMTTAVGTYGITHDLTPTAPARSPHGSPWGLSAAHPPHRPADVASYAIRSVDISMPESDHRVGLSAFWEVIMHPLVARARTAQQRARHVIDVALGPLDINTPTVAEHLEREQLEYACRSKARELLTDDVRQWLADAESAERDATIADTADRMQLATLATSATRTKRPAAPAEIAELHTLLTLADLAASATIEPQDSMIGGTRT